MGAVRAENITTNVAAAKIYGFEVETLLRPMDGLTIGANVAYLHARYTNFCADTNGVFTNGAPEVGQCGPATPILINGIPNGRSEEHTSELQSLTRHSYAGFCL